MNEPTAFAHQVSRAPWERRGMQYGPAASGHNQTRGFQQQQQQQQQLHQQPQQQQQQQHHQQQQKHDPPPGQYRIVRSADQLTEEELATNYYQYLEDAETDGIDQSVGGNLQGPRMLLQFFSDTSIFALPPHLQFSLFDESHPDGLNFYDLRLALLALGFKMSNPDLKTWMDRFGTVPSDWRAPDHDPKAKPHTVELRMTSDHYRHVAACLVAHQPPRERWTKAFAVFDVDKKGMITVDDIKRTSQQLGKDLTDNEILRMVQEADIDARGGVVLEEFIIIMERASRKPVTFA